MNRNFVSIMSLKGCQFWNHWPVKCISVFYFLQPVGLKCIWLNKYQHRDIHSCKIFFGEYFGISWWNSLNWLNCNTFVAFFYKSEIIHMSTKQYLWYTMSIDCFIIFHNRIFLSWFTDCTDFQEKDRLIHSNVWNNITPARYIEFVFFDIILGSLTSWNSWSHNQGKSLN